MSGSDVLVILNADIQIDDPNFLVKLAGPVIEGRADLTSCPIHEKEPVTFLEKSVYTSMRVKSYVFEAYNNGDNVYTCHGTARALSKKFYKSLEFKEGPGEDAHSYFSCITNGYKYEYIKDTHIKYRLSDNFVDYQKQNLRFIKSKELMSKRFGKDFTAKHYTLPLPRSAPMEWRHPAAEVPDRRQDVAATSLPTTSCRRTDSARPAGKVAISN